MIKVHRRLTLLQADPDLLRELDLRGILDGVPQVPITERIRLVEESHVEALMEQLVELGYMPGVREA
jgi:hypothetical protein